MDSYCFSLIVETGPLSDDEILNAADSLAESGCDDASICGHQAGMAILFERAAPSLQHALTSAVSDVERAGYAVARIEIDREALVS